MKNMSTMRQQKARGGISKLHSSISEGILSEIRSGNYPLRGKLPSESDLVKEYGVSATTIRKSLANLELRGIIRREQGRGSFVSLQSGQRDEPTRLRTVGFIFERLGRPCDDPVGSQVLLSFANASCKKSMRLFLAETDFDAHLKGTALIRTFEGTNLDGVIAFFHEPEEAAERLSVLRHEFPSSVVFVPGPVAASMPVDCIDVNTSVGMRQVMDYLLGLGHRNIGYVGPHISYKLDSGSSAFGRFQIYRNAMANSENLNMNYVVETPFRKPFDNTVAKAIIGLVRRSDPVSVIVAYNDMIASYILDCLAKENIRIPYDVSLVGHDDNSFASHLVPALTTVAFPYDKVAETAIDLMQSRLLEPNRSIQKVTIPTQLMPRSSVKQLI